MSAWMPTLGWRATSTSRTPAATDGSINLTARANPRRFIERYPDCGILDSYDVEDADEIHCLDFWVYLEGNGAQISTEGWDHLDVTVPLTGSGGTDGAAIAAVFAAQLRVGVDPA